MESSWREKQPVPGPKVFCPKCLRTDTLWFCNKRQSGDPKDGTGQYKWQWTMCCGEFMTLDKE